MMKFFGGLLMAIGILIGALSGLCSAYFIISILSGGVASDELGNSLSSLLLVGIVGGLPCLSGIGLFFWGRWLLRRARAGDSEPL